MYAVPYELYERHRVRRYGFHGTSHAFVAGEAAHRIGKPLEELQLVTAHLGNGCSACAIKGGRSVDTTMGLTPLEGLVMGSRSGDVDPNLHQFLADQTGRSLAEITDLLNRRSGLLGLSGASNDMRTCSSPGPRRRARGPGHRRLLLRLAKSLLRPHRRPRSDRRLVFTGGTASTRRRVRAETLAQLGVLARSSTLLATAITARARAAASPPIARPFFRW